ncbi:tRNA threonylcarbamoyladenosine biosynthesis protein TsaE [Rhodovulum iodosum]|uniref:tRNA threonylcarbamoyladenosine biosynthesis protein TsaE n=1 Tax=Rhodovulum iodosum TaxID=68291 RepID=A0ABV3XRJ1_9RHOB|nr:tRNA (adenosine(37)-N6)-threonylcarbamoyltransferase complex ATPase subunit type 1 TsaE [Rhodovulum robiginosum]RSK30303.1 tRNA (adenosine(37)-N6)-threonylcarbamoyltransferase complex ATPase subunit type 1 TsaE [Rhodovulum robiginosum]
MTGGFPLTVMLGSEADTAALAARLGAVLGAGDVVLLQGPIGAGKTAFARALIQSRQAALGPVEDVPSPTFTLVQSYRAGELEILHADLYRLSHPDEALELGLEDGFETALCLVEWPERLGSLAPEGALWLRFAPGDGPDERRLTVESDGFSRAAAVRGALETVRHDA